MSRGMVLRALLSPSVADVIAFEALPDETQALARRALSADGVPDDVLQLVAKAWRDGFRSAAEQMYVPYCSERDAKAAARRIVAGYA